MKNYDVIILGAGASGLMCAGSLSKKLRVGIIEGNAKAAQKVKISGGGKCNITNRFVDLENFDGENSLIASVFKHFDQADLLEFLDRSAIDLELRKGRYYFCKAGSQVLIDQLLHNARHSDIYLGQKIDSVVQQDQGFLVKTDKSSYRTKALVVATGGASFAQVGATDIGLQIAADLGVAYKKFSPALVGLTVQKEQFWMKELSGLSTPVAITVGGRTLYEDLLFTHKGISGPAVLSASLHWRKGALTIDFLPKQSLQELLKNGGKRALSSSLGMPKRLAKSLLAAIGCQDKAINLLKESDYEKLQQLHTYSFSPAGNFGFSKAEVSRGGVEAEALQEGSLEVKAVPNLYFIGEVVDVTGELGGYNFQWAFSSGYSCAKALQKSLKV